MQAGTFSITNFGSFGSVFATPVINQPQVAILGVGTVEKMPVVIDDAIAIRSMCYLALTFDHRLIDGALADQFTGRIKAILQDWSEEVIVRLQIVGEYHLQIHDGDISVAIDPAFGNIAFSMTRRWAEILSAAARMAATRVGRVPLLPPGPIVSTRRLYSPRPLDSCSTRTWESSVRRESSADPWIAGSPTPRDDPQEAVR